MDIKTKAVPANRLYLTANSTAVSITNPIPTITEPTGDGVIDLRPTGSQQEVPSFAELIFFGAGSSGNTGTAEVILWRNITNAAGVTLWIPEVVLTLSLTVGALTGVAGAPILNTELFVASIVQTSGFSAASINSPGTGVASAILDLKGAQKVEVRLAVTTATNLNVTFRGY